MRAHSHSPKWRCAKTILKVSSKTDNNVFCALLFTNTLLQCDICGTKIKILTANKIYIQILSIHAFSFGGS